MKKIVLLLIVIVACGVGYAAEITVDSALRLGLPVVIVETQDNEEPTADVIDHPDGAIGSSITNATKVPGRVVVLSVEGDTVFDSGEYVKKKSGMTIKLRGNSSAAFSYKKPYKIKLQKSGDMLGRGDTFADKDWALLRNDWNNLNTLVALKVCGLVGQDWTPSMEYVNLLFNGDYRGIYMLSETVERNKDCRINVKKDGYIIESDPYWWNEDAYFDGALDMGPYKYTFKYPDPEDLTEGQLDYIKRAVVLFENSLTDGTYDEYMDVGSFVNWLLIHDVLGTGDPGGSNRFLTKKDSTDGSLLQMGPAWDFDTEFTSSLSESFAPIHNELYFPYLFGSTNKVFSKAFVSRWNEVKDTVFSQVSDFLEDLRSNELGKAIDKTWKADNKRWGHGWAMKFGLTVGENVDSIEDWFTRRKVVLDSLVSQVDTVTTTMGITNTRRSTFNVQRFNDRTYNLLGQEVAPNTKGIVIRKGRKYINQ